MADLSSRLAKLKLANPFKSETSRDDDEDFGEQIDDTTVAGGGHSTRPSIAHADNLRISRALRQFLVAHGVVTSDIDLDAPTTPALRALLDKPHVVVPPELTDRSHPLPEYFVSSSHNTYLMAHQLFGKSDAGAYETALRTGSRCVEIDAWDNDDGDENEPKVTHGYTLVSNIPFRTVCETIRDVVDQEASAVVSEKGYRAAPILLSLENHCGPKGQLRLAEIMREVFGERLLSKSIREKGHAEQEGGQHIRLEELGSKVVVIVEYHIPGEVESDSDSSSDSSDDEEEERQAREKYKQRKKEVKQSIIIPELAELGVYAQSVKPSNNTWYESELTNAPHHHLINVSEVGLAAHMPANSAAISRHNSKHLMRVFPKGTRISSANLHPVPFWGVGAQICAMNWQTFGAAMQLNEALFSGTDGYVLKPSYLRPGGENLLQAPKHKRKLRLHVAGATDIPVHGDREATDIKPYLTCILYHPSQIGGKPPKRKTAAYRQHKVTGLLRGGAGGPPTDPLWDETLEWEYDDDELVFLRMLIKSDDAWAVNPMFAVAAVRVSCVTEGWNFVRMLDLKGHETKCTILVRFEISDA